MDEELIIAGGDTKPDSNAGKPAEFDGLLILDPASIDGGSTGSAASGGGGNTDAPKRRGRKPGSTNRSSSKAAQNLDINGLEALLLSVHMMGAAILKVPELAMDKTEAHLIAQAASNVSRHYNVAVAAKTMDWMHLISALGMVYVPRVVAINARAKQNRPQRVAQPKADTPKSRPQETPPSAEGTIVNIPGIGDVDQATGKVVKPWN